MSTWHQARYMLDAHYRRVFLLDQLMQAEYTRLMLRLLGIYR